MVKQTKYTITGEIDKLNETETLAVVNYISQLLSKRISKSREPKTSDDLILSLSDDYENRRARQVVEWEKVRRQNAQRSVWRKLRITNYELRIWNDCFDVRYFFAFFAPLREIPSRKLNSTI